MALAAVALEDEHPAYRLGGPAEAPQPISGRETFLQVNAMFLGRIDLGVGRATSGPRIDFASSTPARHIKRRSVTKARSLSCCTRSTASQTTGRSGTCRSSRASRGGRNRGSSPRAPPERSWLLGPCLRYCFAAVMNPSAAEPVWRSIAGRSGRSSTRSSTFSPPAPGYRPSRQRSVSCPPFLMPRESL